MRILNIDAMIKCTIHIYIKYQNFNKHTRYTIYETFDHIGEFNRDLNMIYPINNFYYINQQIITILINCTNRTSHIFLDTINYNINITTKPFYSSNHVNERKKKKKKKKISSRQV